MKPNLLFVTSYPYTTGIIAIIWLGSVLLFRIDGGLPLTPVLIINSVMSVIVAMIGYRR